MPYKRQKEKKPTGSFLRSLQFPEDCVKGTLLVSVQGQNRICIENFRGISSYTSEEIRLVARQKKICITGCNLKIDCYTKEEIEISGRIDRLEYL